NRHVRWHLRHECCKLFIADGRASRIIRVADKYQAGLLSDRSSQTIHVQSLLRSKLHGDWRCANDLRKNWISLKATPRENDFIVSGGGGVNQLLAQCRGTGADRSLIKLNA